VIEIFLVPYTQLSVYSLSPLRRTRATLRHSQSRYTQCSMLCDQQVTVVGRLLTAALGHVHHRRYTLIYFVIYGITNVSWFDVTRLICCVCHCAEERKICDGLKLATRPHSTPLTLKWL